MPKSIQFRPSHDGGMNVRSEAQPISQKTYGKPTPIGHFHDRYQPPGKVKIIVPADPEKVRAYHESEEYKRMTKEGSSKARRFNTGIV